MPNTRTLNDLPDGVKKNSMASAPINNGRKTDGTFAPGNALGGRTKESRHRSTMAIEALLDGQAEAH
jgi:hypothetical protein